MHIRFITSATGHGGVSDSWPPRHAPSSSTHFAFQAFHNPTSSKGPHHKTPGFQTRGRADVRADAGSLSIRNACPAIFQARQTSHALQLNSRVGRPVVGAGDVNAKLTRFIAVDQSTLNLCLAYGTWLVRCLQQLAGGGAVGCR